MTLQSECVFVCCFFFSCALGVIKASTISLVHLNRFRLLAYTMRVAQLSQEVLVIVLKRTTLTMHHHPIFFFECIHYFLLLSSTYWNTSLLNFPTLFLEICTNITFLFSAMKVTRRHESYKSRQHGFVITVCCRV